ncbi:SpoIVB peptidase [Clostridia bacterium]|nr:SpoIVB peptidase [Clostridia bacterium]
MITHKLQRYAKHLAYLLPLLFFVFAYHSLLHAIPDQIRMVAGREESFHLKLPLTGEVKEGSVPVFTNQSTEIDPTRIHLNLRDSFTLSSQAEGEFSISCKLFGLLPVKTVPVSVLPQESVIPCGTPIGIYVQTDGILVIGTGAVTGMDGMNYEPAYHLMKSGDYIKTINGEAVLRKEEFIRKINQYGGADIDLGIVRGEESIHLMIHPVETGAGEYKLGIWVRDDLAGVGTMTYYTNNLNYAALGHPVSDMDTGEMISLENGILYEANILGITKGEKGKPGELAGAIDYQAKHRLGTVTGNEKSGIYGQLERIPEGLEEASPLEIGMKQDVALGAATIISTVSGERKEYEVVITDIAFNSSSENKGIQFKVIDPALLNLTGGIVQGMSGSPIIQNGKLIGAITHVFVQDAAKGYGIFIENMMP